MKRFFMVLIAVLVLMVAIAYQQAPGIIKKFLIQKAGEQGFSLQLGSVELKAFNRLVLNAIVLEKKKLVRFNAKQCDISLDYFAHGLLRIKELHVHGAEVKHEVVDLKDINIEYVGGRNNNRLSIGQVKYSKLTLAQIIGNPILSESKIDVVGVSAETLAGNIAAKINIVLSPTITYSAKLTLTNLSLPNFIDDFEIKEKVEATGILGGKVMLSGDDKGLVGMDGALLSVDGGDVTIKDMKFIENMAKSTNQPMNLLVDSLRNYHYNNGIISLGMDARDMNVNVRLDGQEGKRDFYIVLHHT